MRAAGVRLTGEDSVAKNKEKEDKVFRRDFTRFFSTDANVCVYSVLFEQLAVYWVKIHRGWSPSMNAYGVLLLVLFIISKASHVVSSFMMLVRRSIPQLE